MSDSISKWIPGLRASDAVATQQLWNRFYDRLVDLARVKLRKVPRKVEDEDDIASSVFFSLCRGAAAGRFRDVQSRDELWWVLLAITRQKVADYVRRETAQKRGAGNAHDILVDACCETRQAVSLDELIVDEPTPDFIVSLQEQHDRLLSLLRDDTLRQIAQLRIEGYTVGEIAISVSVSVRSVERKLRLIRTTWAQELNDDN